MKLSSVMLPESQVLKDNRLEGLSFTESDPSVNDYAEAVTVVRKDSKQSKKGKLTLPKISQARGNVPGIKMQHLASLGDLSNHEFDGM